MTIGAASVQGIHNAESLLNATAAKVANQNQSTGPVSDEVSLSEDDVALLQAKNDTAANVNAFRVASELEKTVLSILG
jgi:UDP-N-acetylglucosamine:LPS N-acetylglucosamine transferase